MTKQTGLPAYDALEPAPVWRLFADIAATPRPSKKEERIRAHIRAVAEQSGLALREDGAGNIVVDVPASPGLEQAPSTVLQGHLDMVPEKRSDSAHDFENDPIRLIVDKDPADGEVIVRADGTTLGADNGIGVAMALAAARSPEVIHGPLELLLTTDEEAGMTGAKVLTPASFRGRRLINLDSEEDDTLYIGCAGGCDSELKWTFDAGRPAGGAETLRVAVSGLRGGHSGSDIHENRGNAIRLLARTLSGAAEAGLRLATITGGSKRNVIPRAASAVVSGPAGILAVLQEAADRVRAEGQAESRESELAIQIEPATDTEAPAVLTPEDTKRLLAAIMALPHGVLGMHPEIPSLVETSNNVATISNAISENGARVNVAVSTLTRSSSAAALHAALSQIAAVGRLGGAAVETANDYPGWEPNVESPILATCRKLYERLFSEPPQIKAIHAGLECGLIGERVGDMDMVSFGPRIEGAHGPEERVYVSSVQKSWRYLVAVLAELARG